MRNQVQTIIQTATEIPPPQNHSAVALCVFTGGERPAFADDERLKEFAGIAGNDEFDGEAGESLLLYMMAGGGARRVLLVGGGAAEDFDALALNRAAGMAARDAREAGVRHLSFVVPKSEDEKQAARNVTEGALMGLYDGGLYQNTDEPQPALERLTLIVSDDAEEVRAAVERGRIIAEAVNWARELSDEPGASLPPREFMARAAEMAAEFGLTVESLDTDEIKERGMGGLWGVGKGSDQPPVMIVVRYDPPDAGTDDELWAFVGKGITFDTGGLSLKHGLDMYEMKSDMGGGAAVLGAMRVIAQLKPLQRIVGIIPSAENMPSGRSIKPGDIVKTLAGKTIEVIDTDAEGRLVLVDGIAYAKQLGAARIVDLATLTGSIIVALGDHRTGLFSTNDEWAAAVGSAASRAGEPVWRMPVGDDYKKRIESDIADFKNYGGRPDATGAALLLSKFADQTPWVHLDIAGTSWYDDARPYAPKGSSGTGVRTLVELVCQQNGGDK